MPANANLALINSLSIIQKHGLAAGRALGFVSDFLLVLLLAELSN
jgi:hypothetical protein